MPTNLIKIVCKRAALMRAPYAQSSWTINTSTIKKKSSSRNKTAISIPNKSILSNDNNIKFVNKKRIIPIMSSTSAHRQQNIINDIYMRLIQLLDINENGRLVLPFSRRLILIDRPRQNLYQNADHIHNNKCTPCHSPQYERSTSSSESYLTSDDENYSEHNTSFPSISLPPSPFLCDPYESYDWEC
ncbi:unnamed protein product [Rotaria sp. Silwood1]|nr:unnamed protein product [Rotaria sp. Silwood1]CAF4877163.1 unnamed protein product [Rotaria sp. Silwood1]